MLTTQHHIYCTIFTAPCLTAPYLTAPYLTAPYLTAPCVQSGGNGLLVGVSSDVARNGYELHNLAQEMLPPEVCPPPLSLLLLDDTHTLPLAGTEQALGPHYLQPTY